jgi:allantoinase
MTATSPRPITSPLAGKMDNPYLPWSPITARPPLVWPDGARIAFAIIVTLEHLNWYPPAGAVVPPTVRINRAYPMQPDVHTTSLYEYGNRVGVFRVMDVLRQHAIRPIVAMDTEVIEHSPGLLSFLSDQGAEFVGHGVSSEQMITSAMSEADEIRIIDSALATVRERSGQPVRGWSGSAYGESARTVRLLAERGVDYVLDWPTDEQPHPLTVPAGRMTNLPVMIELDDVTQHVGRFIPIERFTRSITEQFDRLHQDGGTTGRLFVLNVHPWVMGQPFRIKYFERAIAHIAAREDVWFATGAEIVDWHRKNGG